MQIKGNRQAFSDIGVAIDTGRHRMLRRYQYVNIPTELARSVVSIVELGSFTKAAERLGLTQPAISAQIRRLQVLVGGSVFERTAGGVELSERGKLLLPLVRRLLEANDQILQLGGAAQDPRPIRVGLSFIYATSFLESTGEKLLQGLNIVCDNSTELLRGVADGYVDVAALLQPSDSAGNVRLRWTEEVAWVRSRHFTLSPGSPVPIVGWPNLVLDQLAIKLLEAKGIAYRLAFSSYEPSVRLAAVRAGIGVTVLPVWAIPDDVVAAREYYLPALAPVEAGVISSRAADSEKIAETMRALSKLKDRRPAASSAA